MELTQVPNKMIIQADLTRGEVSTRSIRYENIIEKTIESE